MTKYYCTCIKNSERTFIYIVKSILTKTMLTVFRARIKWTNGTCLFFILSRFSVMSIISRGPR